MSEEYKEVICKIVRGCYMGDVAEDRLFLFREECYIMLGDEDVEYLRKLITGYGEENLAKPWKDVLKYLGEVK